MKFIELFDEETFLPDWDKIFSIKEFKDMETCQQSKVWHKEGNVREHTMLVTFAMFNYLSSKLFIKPSDDQTYIMMMSAAICHDLGKPSTTKFDKEKDDWTTKYHGAVGARITRSLFFDEDFYLREKVCYMVRHHMDLHHIFDEHVNTTRKLIELSHGRVPLSYMLALNVCDSYGSVNDLETKETIDEKTRKIEAIARVLGCLERAYNFESDAKKLHYFHYKDEILAKHVESIGFGNITMYVMIGLPGSGKSFYVNKNLPDLECISRDVIRTEIGLTGEKPQGNKEQEEKVTEIFNERMEKCFNEGRSFVIDNTNILRRYRHTYTEMALKYNAKVVYVYVEASSINENKSRRDGMMPLEVIDRMWSQFDFPEPTEYHEIIYDIQR